MKYLKKKNKLYNSKKNFKIECLDIQFKQVVY